MAADLEFRIGAELTEIKAALAGLRKDFGSLGQAANQAGGNAAFSGLERGAGRALGMVGRLVAGIASVAGVIKLISAADELNTINARLRLVTESTEQFNAAQQALFDLSQRTRSGLGETVKLYAQIANATKDAKVGQQVLLDVVETVNQAVQLSGSGAAASEAALVQLGQGLASGTLRGEELNSILEQTPALADAIAKGMGITRGELRKYGEDGKITAQQVIEALQKQKDEVAAQFAQLPLTVGQSITLIKNAGLQLLGTFDQASGGTAGLAVVLKRFADFLSSDEVAGAIAQFGEISKQAFGLAGEALEGLLTIGDFVLTGLGDSFRTQFGSALNEVEGLSDGLFKLPRTGKEVVDLVIRAFKELPANLKALVRVIVVETAASFDRIVSNAVLVKEALLAIFNDDTIAAARARAAQRDAAINRARDETIAGILAQRDAEIGAIEAVAKATVAAREKARNFKGSTSPGKFTTTITDAQKREAEQIRKALLEEEEKTLKDSTQRALGILGELFEDAKVTAGDYYRSREAIELASLDRSIAIERERQKAGGAEAVKAAAEIDRLEAAKGDVQRKTLRERAAEERKVEQDLAQARAQQLEGEGRTAEAARIRLEAQFRDLLAKLQAEGNTAGVKLIRNLIDTGVAKAQFDEIKAQFDRVTQELQQRQQALASQRDTGALAPATAEQQTREARAEALRQLQELNRQMQELAASTNNPEIVQGAAAAGAALRQMAVDSATGWEAATISLRASLANMQASFQQATANAGVDALTNFFTDIASGAKTGKEALRDFVVSFAQSMAQIAARALATFLVLQLLDAIYPGLGRATAATMAAGAGDNSASVFHSGGMVRRGAGPQRKVPAWAFAGAPRFHGGGMVGLKPDEVPAILQTGERVLSRQDVAAGAGQRQGVRIVNAVDPGVIQDAMSSAAGERVILNVIERNAGTVRQRLAG